MNDLALVYLWKAPFLYLGILETRHFRDSALNNCEEKYDLFLTLNPTSSKNIPPLKSVSSPVGNIAPEGTYIKDRQH